MYIYLSKHPFCGCLTRPLSLSHSWSLYLRRSSLKLCLKCTLPDFWLLHTSCLPSKTSIPLSLRLKDLLAHRCICHFHPLWVQVRHMKLVSHNVNNSSTLPMQICLIWINSPFNKIFSFPGGRQISAFKPSF